MSDEPTTDAEIVSAYLDGEATPEDAARVEADPVLSSRAAALDTVRQQLAVDGPPAGLVDDHVRAALAAFDDASAPPVADLSARRRRLWERVPLGAVAAAVVVLALFGALTQLDSGDDDTSMDVATEAAGEVDDSAGNDSALSDEAEDGATMDAGDGSETFSTGAAGSVLEFADTDELADHVLATHLQTTSERSGDVSRDADPAPDEGFESEEQASDACDAVAVAGTDPATVTAILHALVGGVPVTAVVTDDRSDVPVRRLVVVDERSCSVIDDRPL